MRWLTLVLPVTLFYSLSTVYAIPHEVDENYLWLHKRQGRSTSSPVTTPVVSPTHTTQDESSSPVSPTSSSDTSEPSSRSSSSSSIPTEPSTTSVTSLESSSTVSSPSSSIPSSSSPSSQSSSSTTSTTSLSPSPTTTYPPNTQTSTSYRRFSSTIVLSSGTVSANGNTQTGTGSGSSFLQNKAAVGSTFAIVGLVGVAIIIGAVFFVIKKARKRRDQDELDTYFEKLPGNNDNSASNRNVGGSNHVPDPSAADFTSPAHDQAYMSRDVHYGTTDQYPNPFANYNGFEYPPERGSVIERPGSAAYAPGTAYAAAMSQRGLYHYQGQIEDPNTVPNHPFADPDNRRY